VSHWPDQHGKFWEIDEQGFILNDASLSKVPKRYRHSVEMTVEAYRAYVNDILYGVYIRGTVPRGLAILYVSDLDTFAVVNESEAVDDMQWADSEEEAILSACPELTGVQFEQWPLADVVNPTENLELPFVVKTQSICVFGHDLSPELPNFNPDAEIAFIDLSQIKGDIEEAKSSIGSSSVTESQVRYWSKRIMKNLIRAAFCLTVTRERRYTRDLLLCVDTFCRHYPSHQDDIRLALRYFVEPTSDSQELRAYLCGFGSWVANEAENMVIGNTYTNCS
jgi:uncharacterized protein